MPGGEGFGRLLPLNLETGLESWQLVKASGREESLDGQRGREDTQTLVGDDLTPLNQ